MKVFISILAIIALLITARYSQRQRYDLSAQIKTDVYSICQKSRMSISGADEDKCVRAQEEGHAEYLCDQRNDSPSNHCWVEVK